jgi:hypothetical protein
MTRLVALAEAEEQARDRITAVELDARQAGAELAEAREALVRLEAGTPTTQQRAAAEKSLTEAERKTTERWPERRAGAERAAREARQALVQFATEHLPELVAEIEDDGRAAAEHVNACGEAFQAACSHRDQAERNLIQIVALTRGMGPNDVSRARSGEARQAVQMFLSAGGEDAPSLRIEMPETPEPVPVTAA